MVSPWIISRKAGGGEMARKNPSVLSDPHGYITFDDILALALAKTKSREFVADSGKWQAVLYKICERYKDAIPELASMFFDETYTALPPQSDQFYQFLNVMSGAKLISLPNPTFERIEMNGEQKRRAINLEKNLLKRYEEHIPDIAAMLEQELAVRRRVAVRSR